MQTKTLEPSADYVLAPDGSEVRPLLDMRHGGLGHCTLRPNGVSQAVCHRTIEEIWYFIRGEGQVWRNQEDHELVVDSVPGVCLTIPTGVHFQFRNIGDEPLEFLMATMSPWPGSAEAVRVPDYWETE